LVDARPAVELSFTPGGYGRQGKLGEIIKEREAAKVKGKGKESPLPPLTVTRKDAKEWDDAKDATNTEKDGISFAEALQVFTDSDGIEKEDLAHSSRTEQRLWRIGKMKSGRIVTVVYTVSGDRVRLISAQERRCERR